jgi:hypothetical protein
MPAAKRQRTGKQAGGTKKQPAPRRNQEDDVQDATTAVDAIIMTAAQPEAEEVEETGAVDVKGLQRKGGASRDMEKALWAQVRASCTCPLLLTAHWGAPPGVQDGSS